MASKGSLEASPGAAIDATGKQAGFGTGPVHNALIGTRVVPLPLRSALFSKSLLHSGSGRRSVKGHSLVVVPDRRVAEMAEVGVVCPMDRASHTRTGPANRAFWKRLVDEIEEGEDQGGLKICKY